MPSFAPRDFGRYVLERPLASGRGGEVYLAIARDIGSRCVIKTIPPKGGDFVDLLAREAQLMMRAEHDNVVHCFDCGEVAGQYYLAMEYIHGRDLSRVLKDGALPPELALYLVEELLVALRYLHEELEMVHGDVTPKNVLLDFDGRVKLTDFGGASTHLAAAATQAELSPDQWAYLSPEQQDHAPIDPKSDLYAIGAIAYEALTGARLRTMPGEVPPPGERKPSARISGLPLAIDYLVANAIQPRAEDRFATARTMLDFIGGLSTRRSAAAELGKHVRGRDHVDLSPPAVPRLLPPRQHESRIFAASARAARRAFHLEELPQGWVSGTKIPAVNTDAWAHEGEELPTKMQTALVEVAPLVKEGMDGESTKWDRPESRPEESTSGIYVDPDETLAESRPRFEAVSQPVIVADRPPTDPKPARPAPHTQAPKRKPPAATAARVAENIGDEYSMPGAPVPLLPEDETPPVTAKPAVRAASDPTAIRPVHVPEPASAWSRRDKMLVALMVMGFIIINLLVVLIFLK